MGAETAAGPRHVLLISSWFQDMPWQKSFHEGLQRGLSEDERPFKLYVEYLDAGRFPVRQQRSLLRQSIELKYKDIPIAAVIAESLPAVAFLRENSDLFTETPRILVQSGSVPEDFANATVIDVFVDYDTAFGEMMRLARPARVFLVGDVADPAGQRRLKAALAALEKQAGTVPVTHLFNLSAKDLATKVSTLPERSAIFFLPVFNKAGATPMTPKAVSGILSKAATAPIFSGWETILGNGILGGYLLSSERLGRMSAYAVTGQKAVTPLSPSGYYYDWRQLQRWNIDESRLPEGAMVIHRELSAWEEYRWQIMATLLTFLGFVALILALVKYNRTIKQTQSDLQDSERRFRNTFEQAAVGIAHVAPDGSLMRLNQKFCDIVGYAPDQLKDVRFQDITYADDLEEDLTHVQDLLDGDSDTYAMEKRYHREDGSLVWANLTVSIVRDTAGAPVHFISVIEDISQRKALEEALTLAKEEAVRADRAKSMFLAAMSHDLRTPLNAIMGFSDLIRQKTFGDVGNPNYESYVEDIYNSGSLLISLINDILDLSKVEAGKYDLTEEPVHLPTLLDLSIRQISAMPHAESLSFQKDYDHALPKLRGDKRVLLQIFNNLLSNAVKYTNAGGLIVLHVTLTSKGNFILSISDTGIGISAEEINEILAPFERSQNMIARKKEGTGLGLHLCDRFMRMLGGQMKIASTIGKGTVVTLTFPAERTLVPREVPMDEAS
ncbi:MAG: PAS domain S-box protein [Magnetospiraceae bacterium]